MRCSLSIGLSLPPSSRGGSCGIGGIGGVTCHFFLCLRRTAAAAAVVVALVLAIPPSLPPDLSLEQHHPRWPTSSPSSPISWSPPAGRPTISTRPTVLCWLQTDTEGGRGREGAPVGHSCSRCCCRCCRRQRGCTPAHKSGKTCHIAR